MTRNHRLLAVLGATTAAALLAWALAPRPVAVDVFVVDGGRARLRPVALAGRNGAMAWVSQGLAEGATVVVYPPAEVAEGVRVAPRGSAASP